MSGQLYAFMVIVDIVLAALYLWSAIEILRLILVPTLMGSTTNRLQGDDSSLFSMFSRSLYRSRPVVIFTVLSHLISWQTILPNAVIWTWSISQSAKLLAYLSSIRVWVLLLIAFNASWNLVVLCMERWAYAIAKRTFLTTFELMIIGACVAYMTRLKLFSTGEEKYAFERQRLVDFTSFQGGAVGYANVYDDDHDGVGLVPGQLATRWQVLQIVYAPLVAIVVRSIGNLVVYLMTKMFLLHCMRKWGRESSEATNPQSTNEYERKPIEDLLAVPIRAKSLVRGAFELDSVHVNATFVPATLCFDFGAIVERRTGTLRTRIGFMGDLIAPTISPETCVDDIGGQERKLSSVHTGPRWPSHNL